MEKGKVNPKQQALIIGGSAGSLEVLMKVFPKLPEVVSFAIIIVLHRKNTEDSLLEELFSLKTKIPVSEVEDKVPLQPGYIYIAPSDYHILFEKDYTLSLDASEKVNYSRPSIDVAFESAAALYKSGLTAILLSGANADGTKGLVAVNAESGITVVQNPETALMPFMPNSALKNSNPAFVLDTEEITEFIISLNR